MRKEKHDVVVIGGGPAGSNAARMTKVFDEDLDVALFERGAEPAANCAGGLGLPFYNHMGIRPPEEVVESPIREVVLSSPEEEASLHIDELDLDSIDWVPEGQDCVGWVLDRQAWDNWQLEQAGEEGVHVRTKHTVKELEQNGNVNLQVHDRDENEKVQVEADFVAIATGANWDLAVAAGFSKDKLVPPKEEQHMGRQYHMKDPDFFENYGWDKIFLKFDRRYAPKGYVWSFPEGKEYTRWGNGVPLSEDRSAPECLDQFLKDTGKYEYTDTTRENTMAIIPTAKPLDTAMNDSVGLVGDTGHHCDPLHGGGMMFGARAGKWFAKAVTEGNFYKYDEYWRNDFLDTLEHRFVVRDLLYNMSNDEYDRFVASVEDFEVEGINPDIEIPRMMWHILKKDRGIFTKSAAEATKSFVRQKIGI